MDYGHAAEPSGQGELKWPSERNMNALSRIYQERRQIEKRITRATGKRPMDVLFNQINSRYIRLWYVDEATATLRDAVNEKKRYEQMRKDLQQHRPNEKPADLVQRAQEHHKGQISPLSRKPVAKQDSLQNLLVRGMEAPHLYVAKSNPFKEPPEVEPKPETASFSAHQLLVPTNGELSGNFGTGNESSLMQLKLKLYQLLFEPEGQDQGKAESTVDSDTNSQTAGHLDQEKPKASVGVQVSLSGQGSRSEKSISSEGAPEKEKEKEDVVTVRIFSNIDNFNKRVRQLSIPLPRDRSAGRSSSESLSSKSTVSTITINNVYRHKL